MNFDDILSEINGFGKFQIVLFLIQVLSRISLPCHFLLSNFIAAVPPHHCDIRGIEDGGLFVNLTFNQKVIVGIPTEQDGAPSSCLMFTNPQYQYLFSSNTSEETNQVSKWMGTSTNLIYSRTFVFGLKLKLQCIQTLALISLQWDLVCNKRWMNKATATVFFIGVMTGAPLFGYLSDRFGRRPLLLVSYLSSLTFAILSAVSTSFVMFAIMRFLTGMFLAGRNIEWCSTKHRTFSGIIISLDWTLGNWLLVGIAYGINEWRTLILAATSPLILAVMVWRWLPESARWLIANGKAEAAQYYMMKCAKMNKGSKGLTTITPEVCLYINNELCGFVSLTVTLFVGITGICGKFGVAFTYYGITLNISGFGLNPHLTQFIFASIEMPMKIAVYFSLEKLGRRRCEVTALTFFLEKWLIRTIVGVLGKSTSEASFTIMYLYTTELYPTVVRQNGLGYTAFLARLGVSVSPLVVLSEEAWHLLPACIYCAVALASGVIASLLPETLNAQLPEFIEDIEKTSTICGYCKKEKVNMVGKMSNLKHFGHQKHYVQDNSGIILYFCL
uniref:Major facilitator superfamily (MFS) profile domain-containing protein n=1 Tax=Oryzias latipes TaxID=8090 RepID=A0A3P9JPK4_ORYLA